MKLRAKICILLAAALLFSGLAACIATGEVESASYPPPTGAVRTDVLPTETGNALPQEEENGEEDGKTVWDPSYRLDLDFTPVAAGQLEMPVMGATGYASVELPLWEWLPDEEQPEPIPEPTPEPAPEPTPEPPPAPDDAQEEPASGETEPPAPGTEDGELQTVPPGPETGEAPPADAGTQDGDPANTGEPAAAPDPAAVEEPEPEPTPDPYEGALAVLAPGTAFTILEEEGGWWWVTTAVTDGVTVRNGTEDGAGDPVEYVTGWIEHRYCFINLPDVIPSIVYNDTNSDSSRFVSCGKNIPDITGQKLYSCKTYNPRLGREEYLMPVLYTMAKHICQAQQAALAEGNTLVLYETYRPYETQRAVVKAMVTLSGRDPEVKAGISTPPWSMAWFISTGISNHQRGFAIDVSLAKVTVGRAASLDGYPFVRVRRYEEYTMPTPIHELSMAAATFTTTVASLSSTAWRSAELSPAMRANEPALALQRYCTGAELTPLASEWWHFNDLQAYDETGENRSDGRYFITECRSVSVSSAQSLAGSISSEQSLAEPS